MFKKYIYIFISIFTSSLIATVYGEKSAESHQDAMLPGAGNKDGVVVNKLVDSEGEGKGDDQLFSFFEWIRNSMETLLPIVAVGVFLFIGIRIAVAKGNPEEFKKAWTQMTYAIVGIFIVGFAWAAVKLVSGLNI